jgi:hypothetical protein
MAVTAFDTVVVEFTMAINAKIVIILTSVKLYLNLTELVIKP